MGSNQWEKRIDEDERPPRVHVLQGRRPEWGGCNYSEDRGLLLECLDYNRPFAVRLPAGRLYTHTPPFVLSGRAERGMFKFGGVGQAPRVVLADISEIIMFSLPDRDTAFYIDTHIRKLVLIIKSALE